MFVGLPCFYASGRAGSRSTPLFETEGSVQRLRFQQQGLRSPFFNFERPTSMRRWRVSCLPVARIQRIHSQRAIGVTLDHKSCAFLSAVSAACQSAGTSGSGQSLTGRSSTVTVSPAAARAAFSRLSSGLNQWLKFPSGSSGVWKRTPLTVPSTMVCPLEGNLALASAGSLRMTHELMVYSVVLKRIGFASFCSCGIVS